ncbi:MAG: hypothetical protein RR355_02140 [Oscillospiraceae bacterium]
MVVETNGVPKIANMSDIDKSMFFESFSLIRAIQKWKIDKEKESLPNAQNETMTLTTQDAHK